MNDESQPAATATCPHAEAPILPFRHDTDPAIVADPFAGWISYRDRYDAFGTDRGDAPAWVLLRYEDVCRVMRDTDTFSRRFTSAYSSPKGDPLVPIHLDPPEHGKYRRLINPLLSPPVANRLEPVIRDRCVALVDAIKPEGGAEFMSRFAFAFAPAVFLGLMGLPLAQADRFLAMVHDLLDLTDFTDPGGVRRTAAREETNAFFAELLEERRSHPRDDYVSYLVQAEVDGAPVDQKTLQSMCLLLFEAGQHTVASTLGFAFAYFAQHPEVRHDLTAHPELVGDAVEEILRYFPIDTSIRYVTKDVEVAGCQMHEGDKVVLPFVAANRDGSQFERPDEFDLRRSPNRHVGFGVGPHRCAGSHLARVELAIALEEWHARIPDYRIDENAPGWQNLVSTTVFRMDQLHLRWD